MVATRLESISACSKLKVHQLRATRLIDMIAFGYVAPADAIESWRRFDGAGGAAIWMMLLPPNPRPTTQIGVGGRWLLFEPLFATNAQ